jgi:hypothetical protein
MCVYSNFYCICCACQVQKLSNVTSDVCNSFNKILLNAKHLRVQFDACNLNERYSCAVSEFQFRFGYLFQKSPPYAVDVAVRDANLLDNYFLLISTLMNVTFPTESHALKENHVDMQHKQVWLSNLFNNKSVTLQNYGDLGSPTFDITSLEWWQKRESIHRLIRHFAHAMHPGNYLIVYPQHVSY